MLGIGSSIVHAGNISESLIDITGGTAAGLQLWLQNNVGVLADGSSWRDSSGNDNHVVQESEGDRAVVSGGGLDFESTQGDHYDLTNKITIASQQGFCLAVVVSRESGATSTILSDGANEFLAFGKPSPPDASNSGVFRFNADAPSSRITDFHFPTGTFGYPTKFLILLNRTSGAGNQFTFMKNGEDLSPDEDNSVNEANGENSHGFQVKILGAKAGTSDFFDGKILELAFWNRSLTTQEIAGVNSYLRGIHGL